MTEGGPAVVITQTNIDDMIATFFGPVLLEDDDAPEL
jgi:hypothetical protein